MKLIPLILLSAALISAQSRELAVTAIPGVIAAGAKWTLAWQGADNADGIIASPDGGLLFAQEQPGRISKLDRDDKVSIYLEDTHGAGALTDGFKRPPAGCGKNLHRSREAAGQCAEATKVGELAPGRKVITDSIDGKSLGRLNDLIADKKGGVYFNGAALFYVNASGR